MWITKVPLLALLFASGCSLFSPDGAQPGTSPDVQEQTLLESAATPATKTHGIEVTWEMPSEPVDGFIIRYGETPAALTKEVTISTSDVRQENDPQYGPVYRYLIKGVEESKKLFVSIAAVKGQNVSNFSEALEAQVD